MRVLAVIGLLAPALACADPAARDRPAPPPASPTPASPTPASPTPPAAIEIAEVAVGDAVSCARARAGEVRCWGSNTDGRAGHGEQGITTRPTAVDGLPAARAIAVGDRHGCAITLGAEVYCWGANPDGQLGDGTTTSRGRAVRVEGLANIVEIDASRMLTCARDEAGRVWCWGRAVMVGDGSEVQRTRPVRVRGLQGVTRLELGGQTSCAVRGDRSVWCWGFATIGLFGAQPGPLLRPQRIPGLAVEDLALGDAHVCLRSAGVVMCAGHDQAGELVDQGEVPDHARCEHRDRTVTCVFTPRLPPPAPLPPGSQPPPDSYPPRPAVVPPARTLTFASPRGLDVAELQGGALEADGAYLVGRTCVGDRSGVRCRGALPHADWAHRGHAPVIEGTAGTVAYDVGAAHGCAVREDGAAVCWGRNHAGQLGDGTTQARDTAAPLAW